MTTINSVYTSLNGQTGTSLFVGSNAPTITRPLIVGVNTVSNAAAGNLGELISSQILAASAVSLTTNTPANVTSISLTAGDWNVEGNVSLDTAVGNLSVWISLTSATLPDLSLRALWNVASLGPIGILAPFVRINVSSTTTVYLSCQAGFSTVNNASGGIFARRIR